MNKNTNDEIIQEDHKKFAVNALFSIFNSYGIFIYQIIISFLLARLLSQELWGYLILATSIIFIILIILTLFPPALTFSLNFYIPRYLALNQNNKLKSMIKNTLYLKLILTLMIGILSYLIFFFYSSFFSYSLGTHTNLLLILAPIIITEGLSTILISIFQGFFKFKIILWLTIIRHSFNTLALIFFLFMVEVVTIESIAFINMLSSLIPFVISCCFFYNLYHKIEDSEEEKNSFRENISKITRYGAPLSIAVLMNEIWKQIRVLLIGSYESTDLVTGYNISINYSNISTNAATSVSAPLTTSLSGLEAKKERGQINIVFNTTFKFSLFLLLLLTGILIFLSDFFLFIVFGESYLTFSYLIKIYSITIIFTVLSNLFIPLLNARNKTKFLPFNTFFNLLIIIPSFLIGLLNLGIIGAIYGLIFANFVTFIFQIYFCIKIGNVTLNLFKIFSQYLIFLLSLGIAIVLEIFVFNNLRYGLTQHFNLLIFNELETLALITFLGLYIFLTILLKTFSFTELEFLETFFGGNKKVLNLIRKFLVMFKKITYRNIDS
ncbi:MAG: oligosaccharide flippase family protein [Candidatus Lokiarchaeota archaeon]|nr:oligosaccharide flippase family protein [Candidatus Lokiarchaeota archaeon]